MLKTLGLLAAGTLLAPVAVDRWTVKLASMHDSSLTGSAAVETKGTAALVIAVTVDGAPANSSLRWHLHNGPCDAIGAVVGNDGMYPYLKTATGNHTTVNATINARLTTGNKYSIQIHGTVPVPSANEDGKTSPKEDVVLACGDLIAVVPPTPNP